MTNGRVFEHSVRKNELAKGKKRKKIALHYLHFGRGKCRKCSSAMQKKGQNGQNKK